MSREPAVFEDKWLVTQGYFPNRQPISDDPFIFEGQGMVPSGRDQMISWRGVSRRGQNGAQLLSLVGAKMGGISSAQGSIFQFRGGSIWFIGATGNVYYDDFSAPIGVASGNLQVRVQNATTLAYAVYQAGLTPSSAPIISVATDSTGAAAPGSITGARSISITRIRSLTGAESAESPVSNVVSFSNNKMRIEFPPANIGAGQDRFGIYATNKDQGSFGVRLFLRFIDETEITSLLTLSGVRYTPASTAAAGTYHTAVTSDVAGYDVAAGLALLPNGGTQPSFRAQQSFASAGNVSQAVLALPVGTVDDDYLVAQIAVSIPHSRATTLTNTSTNGPLMTGLWKDATTNGRPVDTDGAAITVTIRVNAGDTTKFDWSIDGGATYTLAVAMSTTVPAALGSHGILISWTSTAGGVAGDTWTFNPFGVVYPTGWTAIDTGGSNLVLDSTTSQPTFQMGVYGKKAATEPESYSFDIGGSGSYAPAGRIQGGLTAHQDVDTTTPYESNSMAFSGASSTSHISPNVVTVSTNRLVLGFFAVYAAATYTVGANTIEEYDTSSTSRQVDLDFTDGDLSTTEAPRNVGPPPAGTHAANLGSVIMVLGTFPGPDGSGGSGFNPSLLGQPEQFDLSLTNFLNPTEPPIRVETRQSDGTIYVWTKNSLQTLLLTGDPSLPVLSRALWPNTGIVSAAGACLTPSGVYAFSGKKGAVRSSGYQDPDTSFAIPVQSVMARWRPEEVAVGYSAHDDFVVYSFRNQMLAFHIASGRWSNLLDLDVFSPNAAAKVDTQITSMATEEGQLYLSISTGALPITIENAEFYQQWAFNLGLGGPWSLRSGYRTGGVGVWHKTIRGLRVGAHLADEVPLTLREIADADLTAGVLTSTAVNASALVNEAVALQGFYEFVVPDASQQIDFSFVISGSPLALPVTDASIDFGLRFSFGGFSWYVGGVFAASSGLPTLQAGDTFRIQVTPDDDLVSLYLVRAGAIIGTSTQAVSFFGSTRVSLALYLRTSGASLSGMQGNYSVTPTATVNIYKRRSESATADELAKSYTLTGALDQEDQLFDWKKPNIRDASVYQLELTGNGCDQRMNLMEVIGIVRPTRR